MATAARLRQLPCEEPINDVWALIRARIKPKPSFVPGWISGVNVWYRRAAATALAAAVILGGVVAFRPPAQNVNSSNIATRPGNQPSNVTVQWADDPLDHQNDTMMAFLSNM